MKMIRVKKIVLGLIVLLALAQLVRPKREDPPVIESRSLEAHVAVPPEVQTLLARSCSDCHSNRTVWPWYSQIAPISWFVADDVNQGRHHVNFSDWEAQESPKEAHEHLGLFCKLIRDNEMPPLTYRIMHKESRLSLEDKQMICGWSEPLGTTSEPGNEHHH